MNDKPRIIYVRDHDMWQCIDSSQTFSFASGKSITDAYTSWVYNLQLLLKFEQDRVKFEQDRVKQAESTSKEWMKTVEKYQGWLAEARNPWWKRLFPFGFK
jgi:hypothetical protein